MQRSATLIAFLCLFVSPAGASLSYSMAEIRANPLGTVIGLLDSLAAKVTAEGEAEAKAYKEYVEWCDDAATNAKFDIKSGDSKKESLEATIGKSTNDASTASSEIEDLAGSIASDEGELKEATTVREKEAADFAAAEAELVDAIDTLGRAINIIGKEMEKNPAFMQQANTGDFQAILKTMSTLVEAASFSVKDQHTLTALVQAQQGNAASSDSDLDMMAPAAATYKSQSGNIVEMLEDLKEKAEEELAELRKAESSAKHNYNMMKQSLDDQIAADTKDMDEQKAAKASAEETKAAAVGDLAQTTKALANAKETLQTTGTTCMSVAADHEATMKSRTEELTAIATAKKLLTESSSGAVAQTYSFLQFSQATATGSSLQSRMDLANAEIVNLVKKLARDQHSTALAQLASRISAALKYGRVSSEDPFMKVKGLIADMISKLQKEAESEATEKAYCDEELAKTEAKKAELDSTISKLTAKIDKAASKSASLKESVKTLQAELAKLASSQAEMDAIRREENSAYTTAKQDLELGLSGVRKALDVLRDYYGGAAAAAGASMLQETDIMQQPAMPEKHSAAGGAGGSIIGILEVVESDFAKNLAVEETQESDAVAEYEKTTQENTITKTLKSQDVKYMTQEFKGLDKTISELTSDKDTSSTELSAVLEYYGKIKERCIAKPETYEERVKRREAEISGLKEALSILEGEALVQRRKRGMRGHFLEPGHA